MSPVVLAADDDAQASLYPTVDQLLEETPEADDYRVERLWRSQWKGFADRYTVFEGKPRLVAKWDSLGRYDSSRHVTPLELARRSKRQVTESVMGPGWTRTVEVDTITAEAAELLASLIPSPAVGEYGHLHSAEVREVLSHDQMVVKDLWLLDEAAARRTVAERRRRSRQGGQRSANDPFVQVLDALLSRQRERDFRDEARLTGFNTTKLRRGQRWAGPQDEGLDVIVVAAEIADRDGTRFANSMTRGNDRGRRVVLMPQDQFKPLDEAGFEQMLDSWGLGKPGFIRLLLKAMRDDPKTVDEQMISTLELVQAGQEAALEAEARAEAEAAKKREREERRSRRR